MDLSEISPSIQSVPSRGSVGPTSYSVQMFGWLTDKIARASRRKRPLKSLKATLRATSRPRRIAAPENLTHAALTHAAHDRVGPICVSAVHAAIRTTGRSRGPVPGSCARSAHTFRNVRHRSRRLPSGTLPVDRPSVRRRMAELFDSPQSPGVHRNVPAMIAAKPTYDLMARSLRPL